MLALSASVAGVVAFGGAAAAASTTGSAPDLGSLLQTGGFTGLAAVLLIFARTAYKRETTRSDRLEHRNETQEQFLRDQVVPTMRDSARALADSAEALREATRVLREREGRH